MALLGEAWVVLRAIADKLHGDVKDGLDSAAKDVEAEGNKAGTKYGESFSKSAGKKIEEDVGIDIFNGMNDGFSDATVDKNGKEKGQSWGHGFTNGIKELVNDFKFNVSDIFGKQGGDKDAEEDGKKKGASWISGFKSLFTDSFLDIGDRLDKAFPDHDADDDGKEKGDSWASGFMKGVGGALGKLGPLLSAALAPAMFAGLAGVIGIAVGAVVDLAAGLVSLIGPLGQVSAAIGVVGGAALVGLIQTIGVGTLALKDLKGKLGALGPEAAAAKAEMTSFSGQFKSMANQALESSGIFSAFSNIMKDISSGPMWATLKEGISSTGEALGSVIGSFDKLVQNPVFAGRLSTVFGEGSTLIGAFGKAAASLADSFVTLLSAAKPLIDDFAKWFSGWAQHINDLIQMGAANGKLANFFTQAESTAKVFFDTLKQLGGVFGAVIKAAEPLGKTLLQGWDDALRFTKEYLQSAQGVKALGNFFDPSGQMAANLHAVGSLLKPLLVDLATLATQPSVQQFANAVQNALPAVTNILKDTMTAVGGLAEALGHQLVLPAGVQGVKDIGQAVKDLGQAFQGLATAIGPIMTTIGNLVSSFSRSIAPAFQGVASAIQSMEGPATRVGNFLGTVFAAAFKALEQIIPPIVSGIGTLASSFSGPLSSAVSVVGGLLKTLADIFQFLAPVVGALAPELTVLAAAFAAMKIASAISDGLKGWAVGLQNIGANAGVAVEALTGSAAAGEKVMGTFGGVSNAISGVSGVFGKFATAIPIVGLAVAALGVPFASWISHMIEVDSETFKVTVNTQGLVSALQQSKGAIDQSVVSAAALAAQQAGLFQAAGQWGVSTGTITQAMLGNKTAMDDAKTAAEAYGQQLLLTGAGPMSDAYIKNQNYVKALEDVSSTTHQTISAQDQLKSAIAEANGPAADNASRLEGIASSAGQASSNVNNLATALANLTGTTTSVTQANSNFQMALTNAVSGMEQFKGKALTANDVLNATGPAGATAAQGLIGIANSARNLIGNMEAAGNSTADVQGKAAGLRDAFIKAAESMNISSGDANALADSLLGIPSQVNAEIAADTKDAQNKIDGVGLDLKNLDGTTATPKADLDPNPFNLNLVTLNGDLLTLAGQKPKPVADLDTGPAKLNLANLNIDLGILAGQKPTPNVGLNTSLFDGLNAIVQARIIATGNMQALPIIRAQDLSSGTIANIQTALNNLKDKNVTVTTTMIQRTIYAATNAGPALAGGSATGGEISSDQWRLVGEHGRELIFATKGTYVATYQQAQAILAAANIEQQRIARALASAGSGASGMASAVSYSIQSKSIASSATSPQPDSPGGQGRGDINMPIAVYPSAQMDEKTLAQQVGFEVGYQLRRV